MRNEPFVHKVGFTKEQAMWIAILCIESDLPGIKFGGCWWCINEEHLEESLWPMNSLTKIGNKMACENHLRVNMNVG